VLFGLHPRVDRTGRPSLYPVACPLRSARVPHVRTSVARISYYATTTAYAAFSQRKPHGLAQATNLDRKSGISGPKTTGEAHHSLSLRTLPCVISSKLREAIEGGMNALLGSIPTPIDGCPILRVFAKGGIVKSHSFTCDKNRDNGSGPIQ
jgi:hypothetical protein